MSFKPNEITREHVLKGIEELKKSNKKLSDGTRWEVFIDGSSYPPKEVMRFARMQYDGSDYWPRGGGWPTNEFLEKMGFEVKEKSNDPILNLIQNYKKHIQVTQLKDEQYKWELVQEYSGKPNLNAVDFYEELKNIKFGNIIYVMGSYVIINLAKRKPEEVRTAFKMLFDENNDLTQRIDTFRTETLKIYRGLGETLQHHQDERTIAAYLTLHDSEKYTFYKSSFYKKYCQLIGTKEANKNEKYAHYLELINNLIENYISLDSELINQVKSYLPIYYNGENHMLLAQDILYQMLEKGNEVNYWIFQGSPKIYDAVTAINNNAVSTWTVSAHKDKIKEGDKFILWLTGANAGCYALGTIASEVAMMKEEDEEMGYYLSPTPQIENNRVRITIDYNLTQSPILWEMVKEEEVFSDFKGSNQGTNFTATKEQYDTFLDIAIPKNNDYEDVKKILDIDKLTVFLSLLRDFVTSENISSNDERISFNVRKNRNRLVFIIGNKYAFAIEKRNSKTDFWLISKEAISEKHTTFINQKSEIEAYWNNISNIEKVKPLIANEFNTELNKNSKCPYRKFTNQDFINDVYQNTENMKNKITTDQSSLNQILFGPPGTGKTFNTINEALKIVDPSYFETHQNDRKKLTERFKELLIKNSDENKGQIGFCTFHQSFSYEDFVEGIKPKTTDTKNVYYDIEPGIFKRICQLADSYNSTIKVKSEGKISWTEEQFNRASFYKLSLGNYQDPSDRPIYEYCRDNNYIAIGFGQENDFSGLSESEIIEKCEDLKLEVTAAQQMNYFIHYLKKNNYVIISNGNKYVRAIGKVTGDYEYVAESPIRYNHFRKVEWIFIDELIPIEEIYERGLSQKTMYKIDESLLKRDFFVKNGQEVFEVDLPVEKEKNYVLIIDEINRGNVSSIFGELITLIEKDKRAGCDEELEVTLPYSKETFKVPSNVYLIGTMNTADRSIEALDTALRRRFSFKEFAPKPHLIKTEGASSKENGIVNGIDLEVLLNTINTRIEKLIDKDHKIGHSYFLKVDNKEKLVHAFKNEIIPLLEEYFFGNYGKIGLVLGSSFVEKVNHAFDFAKFEHYDTDIQSDLKEKAVFRIKQEGQWDFSTI